VLSSHQWKKAERVDTSAEFVFPGWRRQVRISPPTGRQTRPLAGWQLMGRGAVYVDHLTRLTVSAAFPSLQARASSPCA